MSDTRDGTLASATETPDQLDQKEPRRRLAALALLSIHDYRFLLVSNGLAFAGFQIRNMGQAWLALEETGSTIWVGIVNVAPALGLIMFSLIGGVVADRSDRRAILVRTKFLISGLAFLTAFLVSSGQIEMWHLIPIGIAAGALASFNNPASQTLVMDVVGRDRMMPAVSLNQTLGNLATIAGPALGGVLLATFGLDSIFYLLGGVYLIAFLANTRIRTRTSPEPGPSRPFFADLKEGIVYVWGTPHVRALLFVSITAIFIGVFPALIPLYARDILDVPFDPEVAYGALLGSTGAGALVGSLALVALGAVKKKSRLLVLAITLVSTAMILFGISRWFPLSMFATFLFGMAGSAFMTGTGTLVQTSVDPAMRARVSSVFLLMFQLFPLGWIIGGSLAELIGPTEALIAAALAAFVPAMLAFALSSEIRRV